MAGGWVSDERHIVPPCRGYCRGERAAWESPATYSQLMTADGRRRLVCTCCSKLLRQASTTDFSLAIAEGRLAADAKPEFTTLWKDDTCGYDVVSAKAVTAR